MAALLFQPCLLGAPGHAAGGGESRREALRQDVGSCPALWGRALGGFSRRTELGILAAAAGAGVVVAQFGGKITREARRHDTLRDFSSWGADYGLAVQYGGAQMGLYLAGVGLRHDGLREFGILTTHSAILSGVFSSSLKLLVGSGRPGGATRGRFDSSFPSGHATGTAALAGTVHRRYGALPALPFHLAALLTGVSRVVDGRHRPVEVVAGWGLGYATGVAVAGAWDRTGPHAPRFVWAPWTDSRGAAGLSLRAPFGGPAREVRRP